MLQTLNHVSHYSSRLLLLLLLLLLQVFRAVPFPACGVCNHRLKNTSKLAAGSKDVGHCIDPLRFGTFFRFHPLWLDSAGEEVVFRESENDART